MGAGLGTITSVLMGVGVAGGDFNHKKKSHCDSRGRVGMMGPQARECQQPPDAGRGKELTHRQTFFRHCGLQHLDFDPVRQITG